MRANIQHPWLNTAIKAAQKAGDLIMRAYPRLEELRIDEKKRFDLVTQVDRSAEEVIIELLRKNYPDHGFWGEESGIHRGRSGADDITWIIDPLDGTTNFVHGFPHFAVSIACRVKNEIEHGVVYDPTSQELFTASRGNGAVLNDRRIRVSSRLHLNGALVATGFPSSDDQAWQKTYFDLQAKVANHTPAIRSNGSAALSLAYVAAGRLDAYWEFGLHAWDIAAGALLVREAGGFVSDFNDNNQYLDLGTVVAGNPKVHAELIPLITPYADRVGREPISATINKAAS